MKKLLLLFILTIATISPTVATEWIETGEKSYIDIDSIERYVDDYGNEVSSQYVYWTKYLNNGAEYFKYSEKMYNKKIWYIMSKEVIDLDKKVSYAKYTFVYDLKGNVIDSYSDFETLKSPIVPDTVSDNEYQVIYGVLKLGKNNTLKILKGK